MLFFPLAILKIPPCLLVAWRLIYLQCRIVFYRLVVLSLNNPVTYWEWNTVFSFLWRAGGTFLPYSVFLSCSSPVLLTRITSLLTLLLTVWWGVFLHNYKQVSSTSRVRRRGRGQFSELWFSQHRQWRWIKEAEKFLRWEYYWTVEFTWSSEGGPG